MEITDKESHDLQNRLDHIIDELVIQNHLYLIKFVNELREIRDDLPCSCGEEQ
jgi:hypothetical protein|tara:strand:+ start:21 stop:179 length:159 start_codon:yes stop_codon:yes gene_type:complete